MSGSALVRLIQFLHDKEPWKDWAACKGMTGPGKPNIFFPERGSTSEAAKAVCARCPVQKECRDYGDRSGSEYGVWAGVLRGRDYTPEVQPEPAEQPAALLQESIPVPIIPKSLSASSLAVAEECMARWVAEYYHKAPTIGGSAAGLGTACHSATEGFIADKHHLTDLDHKQQLPILKAYYDEGYAAVFGGDASRYDEGWRLLTNWLKRQDWKDREVLSTEVKATFILKTSVGEIPFNYIMDRKDRLANGDIEVIDYKTLSMPVDPQDLKHKIQSRSYAVAAQIEHPDANRIWVTFDMLRFDAVGIVFTKEENRATYKYILKLAEQIIATDEDNPPETLNANCRWCIRKSECATLHKHATNGGIVGITDPVVAVNEARKARFAADALGALASEYEKIALDYMKQNELETLDEIDGYTVKVKIGGRRNIDPERVLAIVGPDIMSRYANVNVSDVDTMLKVENLSSEQKARVMQLFYRSYYQPKLEYVPKVAS